MVEEQEVLQLGSAQDKAIEVRMHNIRDWRVRGEIFLSVFILCCTFSEKHEGHNGIEWSSTHRGGRFNLIHHSSMAFGASREHSNVVYSSLIASSQ